MLKISYRNSDVSFDITNASKANFDIEMLIVTTCGIIFGSDSCDKKLSMICNSYKLSRYHLEMLSIASLDIEMLTVTSYRDIFRDAVESYH